KRTEKTPLSDAALKLLSGMKKKAKKPVLFPGAEDEPRVTLRRPWVQVCRAAGLCEVVQAKGKRRLVRKYRPLVRIHDLRHGYASELVSSGVSLHVVGKLLGHTQPQTTSRYAH